MNGNWDLSFLYQSFDDPKFQHDLAALPGSIDALTKLLEGDMPDVERLTKLIDAQEQLSADVSRLGSYIYLTLAADAENVAAMQYAGSPWRTPP